MLSSNFSSHQHKKLTMASPPLLTPTTSKLKPLLPIKAAATPSPPPHQQPLVRRRFLSLAAAATATLSLAGPRPAVGASDEEYVKESAEVIGKVRNTINMDKNDPNIAAAVAELRETSNSWVAKYRREKALLGRASFRDIYSALNAISGHYISFGPTAPIPAKRKARILEEMDTAEKALSRGR
ncbi:Photosystem II repair protein PSB27-H1 [Hibiscus syriacus]|uniref:Photosystem II repair protein PSB27-H1 n=1 Tax=Hibiscus syriacus TaxID=106335 RepID=A0A6A2XPW9_HIBSY|nr:photosystem II repair protein PSB27-H1, chloroplastic-like [Hibiscus syriacus]KAE8664066.1 Photosystem II repair protein PSB27-H1 [Hibiscus syriacus]